MVATTRTVRPTEPASNRRFRVRARHEDIRHGRLLNEPTYQAAAIAFVEHLPVSDAEQSGISVVVQDVETGHEHSFWVHFDGDEIAADP